MSTQSNQGPPDLDEVLRGVLSFLFRKRDRHKKPRDNNLLKRLLQRGQKNRFEKRDEPDQAVPVSNGDRRKKKQVQSQSSVKKEVSQTQTGTVDSKTETRGAIAYQATAAQLSRSRPTELVKAGQVVKQNVNADSTREWLTDPRALRQAFVLKELLEPPIALRKRPR